MSEAELQRHIMVALNGLPNVRVFRNSVGYCQESRVRYGLALGSADLIGWRVSPGGVAQFVSIEVKSEHGRVRPDQEIWLAACLRAGACAAIVRSVDEALSCVRSPPAGGWPTA